MSSMRVCSTLRAMSSTAPIPIVQQQRNAKVLIKNIHSAAPDAAAAGSLHRVRSAEFKTGNLSVLKILKVGMRPPSPSPSRTMTLATLPQR